MKILRELDIGLTLKAFILALVCLLLRVAPVSAQQAAPTPSPGDVAGQVASAVERVGGTTNALQLGILILLILGAWIGLRPLIENNAAANRRADSAFTEAQAANRRAESMQNELLARIQREDQENVARQLYEQKRDAENADTRTRQIDGLERLAKIVADLETKRESELKLESIVAAIAEHNNAAQAAINKHVDERIDVIDGKLDQAVLTLQQLREQAVPYSEVSRKLDEALQLLHDLQAHALIQTKDVLLVATPPTAAHETPQDPTVGVNGGT